MSEVEKEMVEEGKDVGVQDSEIRIDPVALKAELFDLILKRDQHRAMAAQLNDIIQEGLTKLEKSL